MRGDVVEVERDKELSALHTAVALVSSIGGWIALILFIRWGFIESARSEAHANGIAGVAAVIPILYLFFASFWVWGIAGEKAEGELRRSVPVVLRVGWWIVFGAGWIGLYVWRAPSPPAPQPMAPLLIAGIWLSITFIVCWMAAWKGIVASIRRNRRERAHMKARWDDWD